LQKILEQAGFQVRLGSLDKTIQTSSPIRLGTGETVIIEPLLREASKLLLGDFVPDFILLNNDLSSGIPAVLQSLDQPVMPPVELGWSRRLKSAHFRYYTDIANEFAYQIDIDPWLITPLFRYCEGIDFVQQQGMDDLLAQADGLFKDIQKKYAAYAISQQPFLVVKAEAGTYGMAVMTIRHPKELKALNRKQRVRMSMTKGGQAVNKVILQEGVYTCETMGQDHAVAEPVVYLWGECVVGGFYRIHKARGIDENLNAPGMSFEPLPFMQPCDDPGDRAVPDANQSRFYVYGLIAKLSMLAAAREIKES
jgi:glutamate--cysteine ligase